jgi:hypothetical protein
VSSSNPDMRQRKPKGIGSEKRLGSFWNREKSRRSLQDQTPKMAAPLKRLLPPQRKWYNSCLPGLYEPPCGFGEKVTSFDCFWWCFWWILRSHPHQFWQIILILVFEVRFQPSHVHPQAHHAENETSSVF